MRVMKYRTDEGVKPCVVHEGRKWIHVAMLESEQQGLVVRARKVKMTEARYLKYMPEWEASILKHWFRDDVHITEAAMRILEHEET